MTRDSTMTDSWQGLYDIITRPLCQGHMASLDFVDETFVASDFIQFLQHLRCRYLTPLMHFDLIKDQKPSLT